MLAVEALGPERVHALYMPYIKDDMRKYFDYIYPLENKTGINFHTQWIRGAVINISESINFSESTNIDKVDLGNIMARVRMIFLYSYARRHNLLVLGTSNKSEIMTGYFTKWGDGAADLQPIAHLYKTHVKLIAKELGVPENILQRVPSGEIWEGQTDEGEMGITYEELDSLLYKIEIETDTHGDNLISNNLSKVLQMVGNSGHKRERIPTVR